MKFSNSTPKTKSGVIENATTTDKFTGYSEFGIYCGIVSFMCFFGNLAILLTFTKKKKLRYFGNYFLMSLSLTDLITTFNVASKYIIL